MPLEDFLLPAEEVKFHSSGTVAYGGKPYELIVTNTRLVLYSRRGLVFKSDDVVTWKLLELQGVKYKEKGIVAKTGMLEVHGKTLIQLSGPTATTKALYQQIMQFL